MPGNMRRKNSFNKQRKRLKKAIVPTSLETASDSDSGTLDHPDTNAINCSLNELYKQSSIPAKRNISVNEEKEETEANKEIEKALKKKARLKERFIFSPSTTFDDLSGIDKIVSKVKIHLGIHMRKRILISGVTGVGKSAFTEGIINYCGLPALKCSFKTFSGNVTEVESSCKSFFNLAKSIQPCIIVMDGLDRIVGKQIDSKIDKEQDTIMLTLIESFEDLNKNNQEIIFIGTTHSVDSLDRSFMNAVQFTKKIHIDVPDEKTRSSILSSICKSYPSIKTSDEVNFDQLGIMTTGYVAADLRDLVTEAAVIAKERLLEEKNKNTGTEPNLNFNTIVSSNDFYMALKLIKPFLKSDGFAKIPDVTWADIGALDHVREELLAEILLPIKYPDFIEAFQKKKSCGILLYGPPGCGKTSIAKALANEGGVSFISIAGPEVLDKYVGESEKKIREIFEKAEKAKPCVIFFDEIDSLCRDRKDSQQSNASQNVLSQLLTVIDGFDSRSCFILAATNRVDDIDVAMLRPGRFDQQIYVGIPDKLGRFEILKAIARSNNYPFANEVSLESLAYDDRLKNFTGADLQGLIRSAFKIAYIEMFHKIGRLSLDEKSDFKIESHHIETALKKQTASITDETLKSYLEVAKKIGLSM